MDWFQEGKEVPAAEMFEVAGMANQSDEEWEEIFFLKENWHSSWDMPVPGVSGIYAFLVHHPRFGDEGKVQYMGQAIHLRRRIKNHEMLKVLRQFFDEIEICFRCEDIEDLNWMEASFIRSFDPPMNFRHRIKSSLQEIFG